jgi:thiol:disulfide interchange protein DsbC
MDAREVSMSNDSLLKKLALGLSLVGLTFSALAADDAAEAVVRKAVSSLAPGVQVDKIEPAPLPGFYQVIASGQLVYVSADGKYLLNGDLLDLSTKKNISERAWADFRQTACVAAHRVRRAQSEIQGHRIH